MALSNISDLAVSMAVLVGFTGAALVLWAKSSPVRLIGAVLYPLLLPAAIIAILRVGNSAGLSRIPLAGVSALAPTGYFVFAYFATRHVLGTSDIPRKLKTLQLMLESENLKKPLSPAKRAATFALPDDDKRHLVIVQGGIADLLGRIVFPEIVVNSENDYMMLGRPFDKNVSGTLRYLDAVKDKGQRIVEDSLEDKLRAQLAGQQLPVRLGAIFETETTGLSERGVKFVFHVATVQPGSAGGFTVNRDELSRLFPTFVQSCFEKYGKLLIAGKLAAGSTILFPLIGAGDGGVPPRDSARWMVKAIVAQMKDYRGIQETYVVAFRESDLQALREAVKEHQPALVEEVLGPV